MWGKFFTVLKNDVILQDHFRHIILPSIKNSINFYQNAPEFLHDITSKPSHRAAIFLFLPSEFFLAKAVSATESSDRLGFIGRPLLVTSAERLNFD